MFLAWCTSCAVSPACGPMALRYKSHGEPPPGAPRLHSTYTSQVIPALAHVPPGPKVQTLAPPRHTLATTRCKAHDSVQPRVGQNIVMVTRGAAHRAGQDSDVDVVFSRNTVSQERPPRSLFSVESKKSNQRNCEKSRPARSSQFEPKAEVDQFSALAVRPTCPLLAAWLPSTKYHVSLTPTPPSSGRSPSSLFPFLAFVWSMAEERRLVAEEGS